MTIAITFLVYLCTMLVIGWVAYRRTRDLSDFVLGGRRLGSGVAALSAGASDMSGWLLLGLPGFAYMAGLESMWLSMGLALGTWANWRLLAARLRIYSENAGNALTLPQFFAHRFRDHSGVLRVTSAFFILLFFLFYTSSGLVAGGKLFESVFDLPYAWAVAAGAIAIVLYTSIGGFLAVSWTDVVQALLMAAALVLVPMFAIAALGGLDQSLRAIRTINTALLDPFTDAQGKTLTAIGMLSLLGWGLGYFGQPHILARFKAIHAAGRVPRARRIALSWVVLTLTGASLAGMAGVGYLPDPLAETDSEKVFILLTGALLHPVVAGICLAAILAAIMSTADSQLLVASSAFTGDIYKTLFRRKASQQELVRTGRIAVIAVAAMAFVLALDPERMVLDLVAYAWAGFGAAFGPALILSLYWRRMTRWGALAGILVGALTVVAWKPLSGGIFDLYEILPGFLLSTLTILVVSLGSTPSATVTDEFDRIREKF